jgi:gliding motility-associated-like protein
MMVLFLHSQLRQKSKMTYWSNSFPLQKLTFTFLLIISSMGGSCCQDASDNLRWVKSINTVPQFIENKGQYDDRCGREEEIKYGVHLGGFQLFFTKSGITYRKDVAVNKERKKKTVPPTSSIVEEEKTSETREVSSHFLYMQWLNCNPEVEIMPEMKALNYYSFPQKTNKYNSSTTIAQAYAKLVYKNIYPQIDIEFLFSPEKEGMKYNLILHPGANPDVLQIKYLGALNQRIDSQGNLRVNFLDQEILEEAPISYNSDFQPVSVRFLLDHNQIQFQINNYDPSKKLIIDPWITNPNFTHANTAIDIEYNNQGEVYVLGGVHNTENQSSNVNYLKKFNSNGVLIWTYLINGGSYFAGAKDISVNRATGDVYVISSAYFTPQVIKLDPSATLQTLFSDHLDQHDFWRIIYDECRQKVLIGLGNLWFNNRHALLVLSADLTNPHYFSPLNKHADLLGMDLNQTTNNLLFLNTYYRTPYDFSSTANDLVKIPVTNLNNAVFSTPSSHKTSEMDLVYRATHNCNIVSTLDFVYSSDGFSLIKWDQNTGEMLDSIQLSPHVSYAQNCWGGLGIDRCNTLYMAYKNTIRKYNQNLQLLSILVLPDTVYKLTVDKWNSLYACGKGFVASMNLIYTPMQLLQNDHTNCGILSASVHVNVCSHQRDENYIFSWNTTPPQWNNTATNLQPGTNYTLTVWDNGCVPTIVAVDSLTIQGVISTSLSIATTATTASCNTKVGTASVVVLEGSGPFQYQWDTEPIQSTPTALEIPPGTFIVTVTDIHGCSTVDTVVVPSQNTLLVNSTSTGINCQNFTGSSVVTVSGGTTPYQYSWSHGDTLASSTFFSSGNYTITVQDSNNCESIDTITILPPPIPTVVASSNSPVCLDSTLLLNASSSIYATTTYSWTGPNGFYSSLQNPSLSNPSPLASGEYSVTTSANGCSFSAFTNCTVKELPAVNFTTGLTSGCAPLTILLNNTSIPESQSITWDFGDETTSHNLTQTTHTFHEPGTYQISLTSTSNGCSNTRISPQSITVLENATASFTAKHTEMTIFDPTFHFNNHSYNATSFQWFFSDGGSDTCANPHYTFPSEVAKYQIQLIANNVDNCPDSTSLLVSVSEPFLFFIPNSFTPDDNTMNQFFAPILTSGIDFSNYSFKVYDRWGELIFETKEPETGWDGTFKNGAAQDGVYTWEIRLKEKFNASIHQLHGHLNLIR